MKREKYTKIEKKHSSSFKVYKISKRLFYFIGTLLRWPTRVTTHYFTTHFELLSTLFKLCTAHSKFFETHFEFTRNSEIFATHFKIFATHFKLLTTHSPQDPKCWQRKRKRLRRFFSFLRCHVLLHKRSY